MADGYFLNKLTGATMKPTAQPVLGRVLVKAGFTRYGRLPDDVPPKPLTARAIAHLGEKLDRAEVNRDQMIAIADFCGPNWAEGVPADEIARALAEEEAIRRRYRDAHSAYSDAVYARVDFEKYKMENSKRVIKSFDNTALISAWHAANHYVDLINDMRPEFASARELIDANAAFMIADHRYDVAKVKFEDAARQVRDDKRAGIIRHRASRVYHRT